MPRKKNYSLSAMTSSKIGGFLKHVFFPKNIDELANNLRTIFKKNYHFYILGGGSNTIMGNQFNDNSCIINLRDLKQVSIIKNKYAHSPKNSFETIQAGPGASLQNIVDLASLKRLNKFDCLNRIPGSIGGAIYGNAGAYGVEIGELVERITVINLKKFFKLCQTAETTKSITTSTILSNSLENYNQINSQYSYRNSIFKSVKHEFLIIQIRLKSTKVTKNCGILTQENSYRKISKIRDFNYPKNFKSPGSTFKNIELNNLSKESSELINQDWIYGNRITVAKLLSTCDAIKLAVNGIKMKNNHCNILSNESKNNLATFEDVFHYLLRIKNEVAKKYKIILEEEIKIVDKFISISDIIN